MLYIRLFFFLGLIAILAACTPETAQSGAPDQATNSDSHSQAVTLTEEQSRLAGIVLGRPGLRPVSEVITCTGIVEVPPNNRHLIFAPVKGFVGQVPQLVGDYVRRGQRLTTLRHPELIQQQRLFLETASQMDMLYNELKRKEVLSAEDAASQRAYEVANANYQAQRATFGGMAAQLSMVGIDTSKLLAGAYQERIGIFAPVSGYVEQININPGKLVNGSQLLYEVLDVSHQHIELQVYAQDLPRIREQQRMVVEVPGGVQDIPGVVHRVGQSIHPDTKTAVVHGHFSETDAPLKPGTYVQAHIFLDSTSVLSVPEEAIVREGGEAFVFIQSGESFDRRPVRTGRTTGGYVELIDFQLPDDQQMVIRGAYYINGSLNEGK